MLGLGLGCGLFSSSCSKVDDKDVDASGARGSKVAEAPETGPPPWQSSNENRAPGQANKDPGALSGDPANQISIKEISLKEVMDSPLCKTTVRDKTASNRGVRRSRCHFEDFAYARETSDGIFYVVDHLSTTLWYRGGDGQWRTVAEKVDNGKLSGGMSGSLLVSYASDERFLYVEKVPGSELPRRADAGPFDLDRGRALAQVVLIDGKSGRILARSESYQYEYVPSMKVPEEWSQKYGIQQTFFDRGDASPSGE